MRARAAIKAPWAPAMARTIDRPSPWPPAWAALALGLAVYLLRRRDA